MNAFALNLMLSIAWMILAGSFTLFNLLAGFAVGYAAILVIAPLIGAGTSYPYRIWSWVRLIIMFLYELIVSSFQVAWDVVTPQHRSRPALFEMPLDVRTDAGIFLLTNLISLTPGTLSIDVSADRRRLLIHAMFAEDPEALCRQMKDRMERWVKEAVE
jgi:multicomponent Na+:H+ antiporter subunit E